MTSAELSSALRTAVGALHKSLRWHSSAASAYSMTEMETIGWLVRRQTLLPTELAACTRVKTQSMSQILNKLERQAIIRRTPSKEDRRKTYITLTARGKKMVEKTRYERDEWLRGLIREKLSGREKEILEKALPVLNKLTDNKQEQD